jgi:histidinol-phosphate aminotransferase
MRTLSKTGLAGLRLGYLLGAKDIINELEKLRLPYNINTLTQSLAECVLDNYTLMTRQSEKIVSLREAFRESLLQIETIEKVFLSEANFITVRVRGDAKSLAEKLRQDGLLIKVLDGTHPMLKNCVRLTVGSEEENQRLLNSIEGQPT